MWKGTNNKWIRNLTYRSFDGTLRIIVLAFMTYIVDWDACEFHPRHEIKSLVILLLKVRALHYTYHRGSFLITSIFACLCWWIYMNIKFQCIYNVTCMFIIDNVYVSLDFTKKQACLWKIFRVCCECTWFVVLMKCEHSRTFSQGWQISFFCLFVLLRRFLHFVLNLNTTLDIWCSVVCTIYRQPTLIIL